MQKGKEMDQKIISTQQLLTIMSVVLSFSSFTYANDCKKSDKILKDYYESMEHDYWLRSSVLTSVGIKDNDDRKIIEGIDLSSNQASIGQINTRLKGGRLGGGTATLIGKKWILGVAHSFLPPGSYQEKLDKPGIVYFTPGRTHDHCPVREIKIKKVFFFKKWIKGENQDNWDLAVAELEDEVNLPYLQIEEYQYDFLSKSKVLWSDGYPNDLQILGARVSTVGQIVPLFDSRRDNLKEVWDSIMKDKENTFFHNLDMAPGQSGSSLISTESNKIIGIQTKVMDASNNRNQGIAITPKIFNWINSLLNGDILNDETVSVDY
ncbi:MAG: hypothetical protein KA715_14415 [Xanthomonadaceae bacterium]|nr:hypothetical protein [Xanthomonadaceae bacterium]